MPEVRKADRDAAKELAADVAQSIESHLHKLADQFGAKLDIALEDSSNAQRAYAAIIARHMEPERAAADRRFARLKDALAVLQEARDALCAITTTQMKMRRISPTLADRMDNVGIIERWDSAYDAANGAGK